MSQRTKREKRIRRVSLVVVFTVVIAFVLAQLAGSLHLGAN
jgi:DMSO reductase anchor subunit